MTINAVEREDKPIGLPWRWRRVVSVLSVAVAWNICLAGTAPPAHAEDVRKKQWYLDPMQAEQMWEVSTGQGVTVAVIDSGVNPATDALRGQVDLTAPEINSKAFQDLNGHGTSMAELIAGTGRNGGIQGLAPGAKILPIRVPLGDFKEQPGDGQSNSDEYTVAEAVRAAADSEAQIISMSIRALLRQDFKDALDYAASRGKLMFAAAGNEGQGKDLAAYPAASKNVAAVAGSEQSQDVAKYSQDGYVVLTAPGSDVPGWCDNTFSRYCLNEGTSNAAALASGAAALIWSKHPEWNANQVMRVMLQTAGVPKGQEVPSKFVGYGAVRPRVVLLEDKGEPGDPDINPLLDPHSIKPTPPSPSPSPTQEAAGHTASERTATSTSADGYGLVLPLAVGGAVALLATAFLLLRRRRNN
ncbi:S8 family serine peptidase [Streptomyces sp. 549]|uniref:S8 family serine peptidase n=1 Tax=Streptomyces sp. 549 TaxID=3049076 RepID=UPI0024C25D41|nr:S8 family serine peptidase [Streptomyces sp. 549]MDK1474093.1 S8 family serine peptidase [Streptomyces sp. 549]